MAFKIFSAAVLGLEAEPIEVEADMGGGELGTMAIVGLPDTAVSEARERVRIAIKNLDFKFPRRRVTVNLAPADIKKQGPSYDLPIAVAILAAAGLLSLQREVGGAIFCGELSLGGEVRPIDGVLPIALMAKERGFRELYVPAENAAEAKLVKELEVFPVNNLRQLVDHLLNIKPIVPLEGESPTLVNQQIEFDMAEIKGQEQAKRALEISAAGGHNVLMFGVPGAGKTLLARTLPSILPDLTWEEALEITKIYSVAGILKSKRGLLASRPFRSPHHSASAVAMVGGGTWPRPGEISLAHRGVLFLDEFAEFPRSVLENLRQPLEDGIVHISRAAGTLSFPAKFILVAAMNPCPCGHLGDERQECVCSPTQIINYKKKISGPILDRIDLHIQVPRLEYDKLASERQGESSVQIKKRVEAARQRQYRRFTKYSFLTNAEMNSVAIKEFCALDQAGKNMMRQAADRFHLSARSYFRILKLARTIADLADEEKVMISHLAEALQYRPNID
ncbi:ATP-binding protein [Candidatus Parcubacteria bacterium]|nr:MAG: ATP-binding protein [Candidatus Parcubacteria bacterium]